MLFENPSSFSFDVVLISSLQKEYVERFDPSQCIGNIDMTSADFQVLFSGEIHNELLPFHKCGVFSLKDPLHGNLGWNNLTM